MKRQFGESPARSDRDDVGHRVRGEKPAVRPRPSFLSLDAFGLTVPAQFGRPGARLAFSLLLPKLPDRRSDLADVRLKPLDPLALPGNGPVLRGQPLVKGSLVSFEFVNAFEQRLLNRRRLNRRRLVRRMDRVTVIRMPLLDFGARFQGNRIRRRRGAGRCIIPVPRGIRGIASIARPPLGLDHFLPGRQFVGGAGNAAELSWAEGGRGIGCPVRRRRDRPGMVSGFVRAIAGPVQAHAVARRVCVNIRARLSGPL